MLSAEPLVAYYLNLQRQWPKAVWDKINHLTEAYRKSLKGLPPSEQSIRSFLRGSASLLPAVQTSDAIIAILIGLLRAPQAEHSGGVNADHPGGANLSMLQLQNEMQRYSQMMTLMSNLLQAQHDTAKSIIQNMR